MNPYTLQDAEAELADAIIRDDLDAIRRLEPVIDALDQPRTVASLHASALWYAQNGLHVFPLTPGTKIPLKGSGGCLDATTDPGMVDKWWTGNPNLNIGIATGHAVDVVDIDGLQGQQSRAAHWEMFKTLDVIGLVSTPRPGGVHLYVPAAPGMSNKAGLLPGVDYRGAGGYVVAPPSVNEQGTYLWVRPIRIGAVTAAT